MTVQQLIGYLQKCPPESEVKYFWDSDARSDVEIIIIRDGWTILASKEEFRDYERLDDDTVIE